MEVIISIGVASIGLFGALALIPVASQFARQGLNEDNKAAVGQSAVAEFHIRGMARTDTWRRWADNFPTPQFVHAVWDPGIDGVWGNPGDDDGDGTSDEIDEAGWPGSDDTADWSPGSDGQWGNAGVDDDGDTIIDEIDEAGWPGSDDTKKMQSPVLSSSWLFAQAFCIDPRFFTYNGNNLNVPFPLASTATVTMQRVTLRSSTLGAIMPQSLADEIFMTKEDLIFEPQDDTTLPPLQQFTANNTKRQSKGDMSWMATLAPIPRDASVVYPSRTYLLSIVVFYKRDLDYVASPTASDPPPLERVSTVTFYSGGVTGGDVKLTASAPSYLTDKDVVADVDVNEGNWLMLGQQITTTDGVRFPVFRWYRVIATDPAQKGEFITERDVTLLGPDWDASVATEATFIPGVVAVYERTINLENSSLWTTN